MRAFSRKTISIPLGIRYSLKRFSCMFASCANTNEECSKPTQNSLKLLESNQARSRVATFALGEPRGQSDDFLTEASFISSRTVKRVFECFQSLT